jgi:hypothetical protein
MAKYNILPYVAGLFFIIAIGFLYVSNNNAGFVANDNSENTVAVSDSSENTVPTDRSYIDISGTYFGLPKKLISQDVDMSKMDTKMQDIYYNGISKLFNGFLYS